MLEVGNGGMSFVQYQLHFSFWCLLKAPLILGFDMYNKMTPSILDLITNTELIAINQDKLGVQVIPSFIQFSSRSNKNYIRVTWYGR